MKRAGKATRADAATEAIITETMKRLECIQLVLGKGIGFCTPLQIKRAGDAVQRLFEGGYLKLDGATPPRGGAKGKER